MRPRESESRHRPRSYTFIIVGQFSFPVWKETLLRKEHFSESPPSALTPITSIISHFSEELSHMPIQANHLQLELGPLRLAHAAQESALKLGLSHERKGQTPSSLLCQQEINNNVEHTTNSYICPFFRSGM